MSVKRAEDYVFDLHARADCSFINQLKLASRVLRLENDLSAHKVQLDSGISEFRQSGLELLEVVTDFDQFISARFERLEQRLGAQIDGLEYRFTERMNRLEARLDRFDTRIDRLEQRLDRIEARSERRELRQDHSDVPVDCFEQRLDSLEARIDGLEKRVTVLEIRVEDLALEHVMPLKMKA